MRLKSTLSNKIDFSGILTLRYSETSQLHDPLDQKLITNFQKIKILTQNPLLFSVNLKKIHFVIAHAPLFKLRSSSYLQTIQLTSSNSVCVSKLEKQILIWRPMKKFLLFLRSKLSENFTFFKKCQNPCFDTFWFFSENLLKNYFLRKGSKKLFFSNFRQKIFFLKRVRFLF